jgi:transcriptional regulator with XRE-family HTH domain
MTIAQKVRELMTEKGISGADVARATNLPHSRVSELLHGKRYPSLDQALSLSRLFGVSVEYLADDSIDRQQERNSKEELFILQAVRIMGADEANRRLLLIPDSHNAKPASRQGPTEPRVDTKRRVHCVYFIEDRDTLLIKIGRTYQLKARLKKIRGDYPKAHVIATIPGHCREEREIHSLFSRYRFRGEWFRPSPLIFEYIAANAASRN